MEHLRGGPKHNDRSRFSLPPTASTSSKRGRSSKATRELILEAALAEFAEHGYEGATTASIARRVGVTQPLVHYHFGSKEALWRTTVDGLFTRMIAHLRSVSENVGEADSGASLVQLAFGFMEFAVANPEFARILNHEGVIAGPRLSWLVEHYLRPVFDRWSSYLDKLKDAGLVRDIPTPFALFAFFGAAQQFFDLAPLVEALYGLEARDPKIAREYTNSLIEIFLTGATPHSR